MVEVQKVLAEIGAVDVPQVLVFNKLDAMSPETRPMQLHDHYTVDGLNVPRFFVSAQTGEGVAALREFLAHEALSGLPEDHANSQELE
jgi:GTP-binding protein HflX